MLWAVTLLVLLEPPMAQFSFFYAAKGFFQVSPEGPVTQMKSQDKVCLLNLVSLVPAAPAVKNLEQRQHLHNGQMHNFPPRTMAAYSKSVRASASLFLH